MSERITTTPRLTDANSDRSINDIILYCDSMREQFTNQNVYEEVTASNYKAVKVKIRSINKKQRFYCF